MAKAIDLFRTLEQRGFNGRCPSCRKEIGWAAIDGSPGDPVIPFADSAGGTLFTANHAAYMLRCENCGYLMLFDLNFLLNKAWPEDAS